MIVVIADDFTGAAEIGGIGLRHGLKVVIDAKVDDAYDADLLVVAANTRALSESEASAQIFELTKKIIKLQPSLIFKKLDSVLRGNVAGELVAQMKAEAKERAVVIAGNPHFKRIIKEGLYYIDGTLLDETSFATDPEFRTVSSDVLKILGKNEVDIFSVSNESEPKVSGISVLDVQTVDDLLCWKKKIASDMVLAGGAAFFDILLSKDDICSLKGEEQEYVFGKRTLFVFGSAFPKLPYVQELMSQENTFVSNMPQQIFESADYDDSILQAWANEIISQIKTNKTTFVSISHQYKNDSELSLRLSYVLGELTSKILTQVDLDDLFIEGGTTALSVFEKLNIRSLIPYRELDPGVIQMKVKNFPDMCVTTKPGSYQWGKNRMKLSIC